MRQTANWFGIVGVALATAACGPPPNALPTGPSSTSLHTGAGRGGGSGHNDSLGVDLAGNVATSAQQPAVVDRDTKFVLKFFTGVDQIGVPFRDAFEFAIAAGSPTPTVPGACVIDPPDASTTLVQRVIDRLDDVEQPRNRVVFNIDKKNGTGGITHNWADDGDGQRYRTWYSEATLVNPVNDVYVFSGGSILSWDTSTGVKIRCPVTGTTTVTLTR